MEEEKTIGQLANRYGFHLVRMSPGNAHPYEDVRGFYRVRMFRDGLLESVDVDAKPPTMKLTELGETVRKRALLSA